MENPPIKFKQSISNKSTFTMLVLVIMALAALIDQFIFFQEGKQIWNPQMINQDATTMWAERLERIKKDLPSSGIVGYISEMDYPGMSYSLIDSDEEFVMTQYTLVPLILDRGNPQHDYVIGNIVGEGPFEFEKLFGLEVKKEYGYGIYLLGPVK